jgi:acyl carrier protein
VDDIEAILTDYLRRNFLPRNDAAEIGLDDDLFATGVIDSSGVIECVLFLERRFSVTTPDEDLLPENFSTISSVAAYVRSRLDGAEMARSR